jgi:hypothetical protein
LEIGNWRLEARDWRLEFGIFSIACPFMGRRRDENEKFRILNSES